ncbi:hypothetical protein ABZ478_20020 [Streptomyces sp. NPDC005706]|uniref:hypothetical protein n=1 Tax=Streptomyces sp. NPDC005706 TaxID=3157169 RepID=UPI0033C1DC0D
MPLFTMRRVALRLHPELDDNALAKVCKQLKSPFFRKLARIQVPAVERVIRIAGDNWDRRTRRLSALAAASADSKLAEVWLQAQPHCADALLLHSWANLIAGRCKESSIKRDSAIENCYQAAEMQPEDPAPWIVLLAILRDLRSSHHEVVPVWNRLVSLDPWNREGHLQMLGYLSPAECGSHAMVLDFVDQRCAMMPPDAPAAGLPLIAAVKRHHASTSRSNLEALLAHRWWQQPSHAGLLDKAVALWPDPGFLRHAAALADLNVLAYALVHARRLPDAAEVFQAIGSVVTPWPWLIDGDPLQRFAYWRARALSQNPSTVVRR